MTDSGQMLLPTKARLHKLIPLSLDNKNDVMQVVT